jgi:two-component system, NarL family, nitrate/nitrite response regulator NarL
METHSANRLTVGVLESQPLLVEGLRAALWGSGAYELLEPARSLEELTSLVVASSPRIVLVDKGCGMTAVVDWLTRMQDHASTGVVVWGKTMTDFDALRLMRTGARGVIRKTAAVESLLACLDSVANGGTWMEEAVFHQGARTKLSLRGDLTLREQQVLELVEQGLRNKEIALELGIQPGTVKIHLKHIFEKTGVRGRFGLALSGLRNRADYVPFSA